MAVVTDMNGIIADYRIDNKIVYTLEKMGYKVIPSMNNTNVSSALSGHPDMQICKCDSDIFVCAPECYEYYKTVLNEYNTKLLCGKTSLKCNYPDDIAYNVARVGDIAICNERHTDTVIKEIFGFTIFNSLFIPFFLSTPYSQTNISSHSPTFSLILFIIPTFVL